MFTVPIMAVRDAVPGAIPTKYVADRALHRLFTSTLVHLTARTPLP